MKRRDEPVGFRSVGWDDVTDKRDWAGTLWTAAAVLVILAGFVGGMIFRTQATGGPEYPVEESAAAREVRAAR